MLFVCIWHFDSEKLTQKSDYTAAQETYVGYEVSKHADIAMLTRARARGKTIGNTSKIEALWYVQESYNTVHLLEVSVWEINLNYVHKELTGDADQQHNLEK